MNEMKRRLKTFETLRRIENQKLEPLRIEYKKREEEQARHLQAIKKALADVEEAYQNLNDENRGGLSSYLAGQQLRIKHHDDIITILEEEQIEIQAKIRELYREEQLYQRLRDNLADKVHQEEQRKESIQMDEIALQSYIQRGK